MPFHLKNRSRPCLSCVHLPCPVQALTLICTAGTRSFPPSRCFILLSIHQAPCLLSTSFASLRSRTHTPSSSKCRLGLQCSRSLDKLCEYPPPPNKPQHACTLPIARSRSLLLYFGSMILFSTLARCRTCSSHCRCPPRGCRRSWGCKCTFKP